MRDILDAFQELFGDDCYVSITTTKQGKILSEFKFSNVSYKVTSAKFSDDDHAILKRLLTGLPETLYPADQKLEPDHTKSLAEALMSIQIERTEKIKGRTKNWMTFSPITQITGNHNELKVVYYSDEAKAVLYRIMGLSH